MKNREMHESITKSESKSVCVRERQRPGDNLRKERPKRQVEGSERASESGEQPVFLPPFLVTSLCE